MKSLKELHKTGADLTGKLEGEHEKDRIIEKLEKECVRLKQLELEIESDNVRAAQIFKDTQELIDRTKLNMTNCRSQINHRERMIRSSSPSRVAEIQAAIKQNIEETNAAILKKAGGNNDAG